MIGAKTRIEISQMHEAVDQKSRTNEQNKRDRHLSDNERAAQSFPASAAGISAAFFQRVVQIKMRRLAGRRQTEDQARDQRDNNGEQEDSTVDGDGVGLRHVGGHKASEN